VQQYRGGEGLCGRDCTAGVAGGRRALVPGRPEGRTAPHVPKPPLLPWTQHGTEGGRGEGRGEGRGNKGRSTHAAAPHMCSTEALLRYWTYMYDKHMSGKHVDRAMGGGRRKGRSAGPGGTSKEWATAQWSLRSGPSEGPISCPPRGGGEVMFNMNGIPAPYLGEKVYLNRRSIDFGPRKKSWSMSASMEKSAYPPTREVVT